MGFAFLDRSFASQMGKREARRDAILTVLKLLWNGKTDLCTISGPAAFYMLATLSEKMPDLSASAWYDKHTKKDAVMFMKEWKRAAEEFQATNPIKTKAQRRSQKKSKEIVK